MFKLLFANLGVFSLNLFFFPVDIFLNIFELFGSIMRAEMLLPVVASSLHKILEEGIQSGEVLPHEGGVDEVKKFKIFISGEVAKFIKDLVVWRTGHIKHSSHVILDFFEVVRQVVSFFFFFFQTLILLTDVFDELNDALVMIVIDTVLDLFVVDKGIVVPQEGFKELRNTILDSSLL